MRGSPADPVLQALSRLEREVVAVRAAIELAALEEAGEQPIGIKQASFKYQIPVRTLRRLAGKGCGRKVGRVWYVFESRLVVPPLKVAAKGGR